MLHGARAAGAAIADKSRGLAVDLGVSRAFFSTAGMLWLYSAVTKMYPSRLAIFFSQRSAASFCVGA
jgi:hypothetical protein